MAPRVLCSQGQWRQSHEPDRFPVLSSCRTRRLQAQRPHLMPAGSLPLPLPLLSHYSPTYLLRALRALVIFCGERSNSLNGRGNQIFETQSTLYPSHTTEATALSQQLDSPHIQIAALSPHTNRSPQPSHPIASMAPIVSSQSFWTQSRSAIADKCASTSSSVNSRNFG